LATLIAIMKKGSALVPGQVKFDTTTYPAPYGYAAYPCTIGQRVTVDGKPTDTSLSAPDDPRTVTVNSSIQYTTFYYS